MASSIPVRAKDSPYFQFQMRKVRDDKHEGVEGRTTDNGMRALVNREAQTQSKPVPDFDAAMGLTTLWQSRSAVHLVGNDVASYTHHFSTPVSVESKGGQAKSDLSRLALKPSIKLQGAKSFPEKLMQVLSQENISDVVTWLPHGRSFVICNAERFTKEVLTIYFKQAKFSSFTRKLYRWGFRHITKGSDADSYYHELFQRDSPRMCLSMYCTYSDGVVRNKKQAASLPAGDNMQKKHGAAKVPRPNPTSSAYNGPTGFFDGMPFANAPKMPAEGGVGKDSFVNAPQQLLPTNGNVDGGMDKYLYQQQLMQAVASGILPPQAYIVHLKSQLEDKPKRRNSSFADAC